VNIQMQIELMKLYFSRIRSQRTSASWAFLACTLRQRQCVALQLARFWQHHDHSARGTARTKDEAPSTNPLFNFAKSNDL
jgi:hypothetical protein